jgi:hypothetical protein
MSPITSLVLEADLLEQVGRPLPGLAGRSAREQRGELDILERGQLVDQVVGLEHEPESVTAEAGQP